MKPAIPSFQLYFEQKFVAEIPMNCTPFTIGRNVGCHLRLLDNSVSRNHCRMILTESGQLFAEDQDSTNGTLLNGARIVKQALQPADVVTLGRCTLVFHDLAPAVYEDGLEGPRWPRLRGRRTRLLKYTAPAGKYVLPQDHTITQFDAVSFAMVRDHSKAGADLSLSRSYIKKIPRLQVVADGGKRKDEVTKFNVSKNIFLGADEYTSRLSDDSVKVFAQPEVRAPFLRVPWKLVERVVAPVLLGATMIVFGKYLLSLNIDVEMERAEKHWDAKLAAVEKKLRYADEAGYDAIEAGVPLAQIARRASPLSAEEVWRKIEARPDIRNYLLFDILDELLDREEMRWSIDEALRNLSRIKSVTSRLPSVKSFRVALQAETVPFTLPGMKESRMLMLSEGEASASLTLSYQSYRSEIGPQMMGLSQCAGSRTSVAQGKVVLAFTIHSDGTPASIFVNEGRSTKEPQLWSCVKRTLAQIKLPPPPTGRLSIVYTFNFAPPTRVTF